MNNSLYLINSQLQQHVTTPMQQSATISYLQEYPQVQHQPIHSHVQGQLTEMGGAQSVTTTVYDSTQFEAENVNQTYYPESEVAETNSSTGAFFPTTNSMASHPNIMINNYGQQQQVSTASPQHHHHHQQQQQQQQSTTISDVVQSESFSDNNNIGIITTGNEPHQQHIYSITANMEKDPNQLSGNETIQTRPLNDMHQTGYHEQQQPFLHQTHYASQAHLPTLLQQDSQPFSQPQYQLTNAQSVYVPADVAESSTAQIITPLTTNGVSTVVNTITAPNAASVSNAANNSSTVVLDRINICINNHYSDSSSSYNNSVSPAITSVQQASPIIPAIQHKAIIDCSSVLQIDTGISNETSCLTIDEPDSTTATPQTPPTTPESFSDTNGHQSHKTEIDIKQLQHTEDENIMDDVSDVQSKKSDTDNEYISKTQNTLETTKSQQTSPLTLEKSPNISPITYKIGEDVFIKRQDGRFYLGTIIDCESKQFLVRFDDKSEQWCTIDEMRKFGGSISKDNEQEQMCVACKIRQQHEIVEICDRCGRGYHRKCTTETSPGSGDWLCKRCDKPLKMTNISIQNTMCQQLKINSENSAVIYGSIESDAFCGKQKQKTRLEEKLKDVYEFQTEDDKFTSDDEIPIKLMFDKAKKKNSNNWENQDDEVFKNSALPTQRVDINDQVNETTSKSEKIRSKRKAFTISKSYKDIAMAAASKRYDTNRACDSSSDENSSSSRGTSLDVIIPPPKNFLGSNNPFRIITPKKHIENEDKSSNIYSRGGGIIRNSIFNTSTLDFSSKVAALKSAGIFPNLSTSNLAKAAGQLRTVRTIKRRLSAKDIMIGPNQEVRRRRTRRLPSNVEVISTTTINPIPSNFFPIHAKDSISTATITTNSINLKQLQQQNANQLPPFSSSSSISSSPPESISSSIDSMSAVIKMEEAGKSTSKPTHERRLRQRPQKNSPSNSRRSSISGASTSSNHSNSSAVATFQSNSTTTDNPILNDLEQSVNKYFGTTNRIESGEQFSVRATRVLPSGEMQFLVEWDSSTTAT